MASGDEKQITQILEEFGSGDRSAAAELLPLVYEQLRGLAAEHFRGERPDHTLQPTVLVHDAYLRIVEQSSLEVRNRGQFFRLASKLMRRLLIDHARTKARQKRGQGWERVTLSGLHSDAPDRLVDVLDLEEARGKLREISERRAELVELRFYGGLTMDEAADSLGISPATAKREWRLAKAWLARELSAGEQT